MSDVALVADLPDPPELRVNPVLPERKAKQGLRAPREPAVLPVLRVRMASQAQMDLPVEAALPERRVLPARLARLVPRERKVDPETSPSRARINPEYGLNAAWRSPAVSDRDPLQFTKLMLKSQSAPLHRA